MKKILSLPLFLIPFLLYADAYENPKNIYGDSDTQPGEQINRARGHFKAPSILFSGDIMNGLYGRGYNGSAFTTSNNAAIEFQANETWSTTANGTKILFKTTPVGSVTPATVGTFQSDGGFLPFSRTEAQLKVSTPTAVGAIYYDSTNKEFVQSTGTTTCLDYGKIEAASTAPDGW